LCRQFSKLLGSRRIVGIDGGIDGASWQCALACEKSGFGVLTADKKFLKVDADGNAKMLEALKGSDRTDHLRVNVSGDVEGDTIKVTSVKLL
jgi:hypothetical protein